MGCGIDKEKAAVADEQKWEYITLSDFRSSSCITVFSYGWLWFLAFVAVAVYAADTFTAVNLLAFNRWSSQVQPAIPFAVSKWIFAACIIFSTALCGFEWLRAIRVMRRGGVAESYLDPLAVVLQSIRMGKRGRGWRRFLVFAELTKSKKGTDYIALFVYFQFKGAIRIILAEGPRQVVNALTLWSVLQADLVPVGKHAASHGHSSFQQFWLNVEALAQTNREQAVIIFTMLFTFVIWVISALSLIIALVLYLVFLWHYIPSSDGRLSNYCRRKIDSRLYRVVDAKVKKALKKEEMKRKKAERRAVEDGQQPNRLVRQPTLPTMDGYDEKSSSSSLSRTDSGFTTLPNSSRPPTQPGSNARSALPEYFPGHTGPRRPQVPSRSATQNSSAYSVGSYRSDAPLLDQAGEMGYANSSHVRPPMPPMPTFDSANSFRVPPVRTMTGSTQRSFTPVSRPSTAHSGPSPIATLPPDARFGPPTRQNTGFSFASSGRNSPAPTVTTNFSRQNTLASGHRTPGLMPLTPISPINEHHSIPGQFPTYEPASTDRAAYGPPQQADPYDIDAYFDPAPQPPPTDAAPNGNGGYVAFNPAIHGHTTADRIPDRSASTTPGPYSAGPQRLRRDVSTPLPPRTQSSTGYRQPQRSATAPLPHEDSAAPVQRAGTAGPAGRGRGVAM